MKLLRSLILILVATLILGTALPALADNSVTNIQSTVSLKPDKDDGHPAKGKVKVIKGEVNDISGNTIKVGDTEILVNENTRYKIPTMKKDGTLANIEKGMKIVALVHEQEGKLYARQIMVVPGKPVQKHHVGTVTAYAYNPATGGSITIEDKKGNKFTFTINGDKFKILPKDAVVKVGDRVTVISRRDTTHNQLIASGVVVHQPKTPTPGLSLEQVTGVINSIDETAKTLTIGTTVLTYDEKTLFFLRGNLVVKTGQEAIAFYLEQDNKLIAKRVLVGIDLPGVMEALRIDKDKEKDKD